MERVVRQSKVCHDSAKDDEYSFILEKSLIPFGIIQRNKILALGVAIPKAFDFARTTYYNMTQLSVKLSLESFSKAE